MVGGVLRELPSPLRCRALGVIVGLLIHCLGDRQWTSSSHCYWRYVLIRTKPASQLSIQKVLPNSLTFIFILCQSFHSRIHISFGWFDDTLCPGKSRKFPLRKHPGQTGIRTQKPSAWFSFVATDVSTRLSKAPDS